LSSTFDGGSLLVPMVDSIDPLGQTDAGLTEDSRPPAPPAPPPAYLIDCAFLT
jgi:hypothetical protein